MHRDMDVRSSVHVSFFLLRGVKLNAVRCGDNAVRRYHATTTPPCLELSLHVLAFVSLYSTSKPNFEELLGCHTSGHTKLKISQLFARRLLYPFLSLKLPST